MYEKSSKLSAVYREKGNASFKNREFFEALVFYNKALSYAKSDEELSFAYANRSAVYLELKKYNECLQNIEWARENEYPKLEKIKEREEKCKKLMEEGDKEVRESFFKLSYPANSKIPFIVENLYMKTTEELGRGIYASTDLQPGDVIAIEEPFFTLLDDNDDSRYKHCCFCMKSCLLSLIPCELTAAVMYCSGGCKNHIYQRGFIRTPENMFTKNRFLGSDVLLAFFSKFFETRNDFDEFAERFDSKSYTKSIFDYDFSDPKNKNYNMDLLQCVLSLQPMEVKNLYTMYSIANAMQLINHFAGLINCNRFGMYYQEETVNYELIRHLHGYGVLLFGSLMNHSCNPNIDCSVVDNKHAFVVRKPIKANEQLFRTYAGTFYEDPNVYERRKYLSHSFNFVCRCDGCINNALYDEKLSNALEIFERFDRPWPKSYEEAVNELKRNWKYIQDHADDIMTQVNYEHMDRNMELLHFLGKLDSFPQ